MGERKTGKHRASQDQLATTHLGKRLMLLASLILLVAYILAQPIADLSPLLLAEDEPKTALILTAHPDDEVMFFTPTILGLLNDGWDVRALCLSNGTPARTLRTSNGDGLGAIRSEELFRSYERLGVPTDNVALIDDSYLQDGMQNHWSSSYVSRILDKHLANHPASIVNGFIVTFDLIGITHHPNHIALAHGCSFGPSQTARRCFALQSPGLLVKFTGPVWSVIQDLKSRISHLTGSSRPHQGLKRRVTVTNNLAGWVRGAKAMKEHWSQLVWFRYLYFAFSRLVWHNELVELLEHG